MALRIAKKHLHPELRELMKINREVPVFRQSGMAGPMVDYGRPVASVLIPEAVKRLAKAGELKDRKGNPVDIGRFTHVRTDLLGNLHLENAPNMEGKHVKMPLGFAAALKGKPRVYTTKRYWGKDSRKLTKGGMEREDRYVERIEEAFKERGMGLYALPRVG